jgi:hypothetical protein
VTISRSPLVSGGGGRGGGSVNLGGQLSEPVGHRAVTEADSRVQGEQLHRRLVLRRGYLGCVPA